jgi:hypothetical protein
MALAMRTTFLVRRSRYQKAKPGAPGDGGPLEFETEADAWNLECIAVPRIELAKPDMHPSSAVGALGPIHFR